MRILKDERGSLIGPYLFIALIIIVAVVAMLWSVEGLREWVVQNISAFLAVVTAALGVGFVLGALFMGGNEKVVRLMRLGQWELSHGVDMKGGLEVVVRVEEHNPLAPWHIVGHCSQCGKPYFVSERDVYADARPHVRRTCRCSLSQKSPDLADSQVSWLGGNITCMYH